MFQIANVILFSEIRRIEKIKSGGVKGLIQKQKSHSIEWLFVIGWRRPTFPQIDAVSSALRGLTSLFGMGRGGPPRYSHHVYL